MAIFFKTIIACVFAVSFLSCNGVSESGGAVENGSEPSYNFKTGAYIEASRNEVFSLCPDNGKEGTWISEYLVSLNAENCISVQAPDLAGSFDILFMENSGRTDTIQVLVDQSYIQMGDYSHKVWVTDLDYGAELTPQIWADLRAYYEINRVFNGRYENMSYNQPLIVDKVKFTMGDAQHYSKVGNIEISNFILKEYSECENLEKSKLPLINHYYYAWRFANERSKKEGLDTAYIRISPHSKDAKNYIIFGDSTRDYNSCESCLVTALDTSASGYRLPFKDEWFALMRSGSSTRYYWGDEEDSLIVSRYAWVSPIGLKPIAKLQSNRFGLYDMIGIAEETLTYLYNVKYWDFYTVCSGDYSNECKFMQRIKAQREISADYNTFRFVRKTPKLHKLEKF